MDGFRKIKLKTLKEIRQYATALGLSPWHINKPELLQNMRTAIIDGGDNLYPDWTSRAEAHTSVWRELFNPNRDYTNIELERIARTIHAPYSHKNKEQLRASIVAKLAEGLPVEEKKQFEPNEVVPPEHPEFQQPAFIEQFNPQFRYYERFHKKTATFTNIPWDENTADIIFSLIRWAQTHREEMFVGHNIPSDSRIYISMYGNLKVSVFDKNTDEKKEGRFNEVTGKERDTTLWSFREMEELLSPVQLKNAIINWIRENYELYSMYGVVFGRLCGNRIYYISYNKF